MSGSSKSLLRALDTAFSSSDANFGATSAPSPPVTALYATIDAYNDKHNSIATTSSSLSDSLRSCYNTHVRDAGELSKGLFFLDVLTRLLPVLAIEDVKVWLQTYLRPALNSAGLDLQFVEKSRQFVLALTENSMDSPDAGLVQQRTSTSLMVMDHMLRAFIGKDPEIFRILGVSGGDDALNTHEHAERLRFVKRNAALLLRESAAKRPKELFCLLNDHFVIASERHSTLVLLAQLSSSPDLTASCVAETPLFANLLRSLLRDFSEAVITSGLYVLVMLIAKVHVSVPKYLPDLFTIVSRLTGWSEFSQYLKARETHLMDYLKAHKIKWDCASVDQESTVMQPQFFVDGEFNLLYLLTLLYGLFPKHLIEFSASPTKYWNRHRPQLITVEHIKALETTSFPVGFSNYVSEKLREQCRRFMVHPNLLTLTTLEQELTNPIGWILESADVAEEDILLSCYELNPDILLAIPDNLVLLKMMVDKITGRRSISSDKLFNGTRGSLLNGGISLSNSTRSSSTLGAGETDHYMKLGVPTHWEKLDRRVSIVPTKLVIENRIQAPDSPGSGVKFKSVNFGTSSDDLLESATLDEKSTPAEPRKKGSVSELYVAHERLFTLNGTLHNAFGADMKSSPMATGSIQTASKTASDLLNKQLKLENGEASKPGGSSPKVPVSEGSSTLHESTGSALDFYQRELLLMKNEMEFMSYTKHLNRFNYLKLKLRFNSLLQDKQKSHLSEEKNASDNGSGLAYEDLLAATACAQKDAATSSERRDKQNAVLAERVTALKGQIEDLDTKVETLQAQISENEKVLAEAKQGESSSLEKLQKLQNELQMLRKEKDDVSESQKAENVQQSPSQSDARALPALSQHEKEIFDLQTQIRICKDENTRIAHELDQAHQQLEFTTKSYEKQLTTAKLDRGQAVREMTSHYEQKIHELNVAIAKFEATLDERNARILQLSTSKPIRIPDSAMSHGIRQNVPKHRQSPAEVGGPEFLPSMHDYFSQRGQSSFSAESTSLSSTSLQNNTPRPSVPHTPTSRQSSTQNMPILRGRGGYQKRSKKVM